MVGWKSMKRFHLTPFHATDWLKTLIKCPNFARIEKHQKYFDFLWLIKNTQLKNRRKVRFPNDGRWTPLRAFAAQNQITIYLYLPWKLFWPNRWKKWATFKCTSIRDWSERTWSEMQMDEIYPTKSYQPTHLMRVIIEVDWTNIAAGVLYENRMLTSMIWQKLPHNAAALVTVKRRERTEQARHHHRILILDSCDLMRKYFFSRRNARSTGTGFDSALIH